MTELDRRVHSLLVAIAIVALTCAAIGAVAVMLSACSPLPPAPPPTYNATSCAEACDNARKLCGPAALTPKKGTCEDVCRVTEEGGGDFRTGCLSAATTCPDVETCSR